MPHMSKVGAPSKLKDELVLLVQTVLKSIKMLLTNTMVNPTKKAMYLIILKRLQFILLVTVILMLKVIPVCLVPR